MTEPSVALWRRVVAGVCGTLALGLFVWLIADPPSVRIVVLLWAAAIVVLCFVTALANPPKDNIGRALTAAAVVSGLIVGVLAIPWDGLTGATTTNAAPVVTGAPTAAADSAPPSGSASEPPPSASLTTQPQPQHESPRTESSDSANRQAVRLPQSAEPLTESDLIMRRRRDNVWNIIRLDSMTGSERLLTTNGWRSTDARVSPDRRTVVYLRHALNGVKTLHAMAADGREDTPLFSDHTKDCPVLQRPTLGADGSLTVVCSGLPGGSRLIVAQLDGTVVRQLDTGNLGDPTLLGDSVVYWKNPDEPDADQGDLYVAAVDGSSKPRRLTKGRSDSDPAVAPDQLQIAFSRTDGEDRWLQILDLHTAGSLSGWKLTDGSMGDRDPSWSPDGTQLAFRRGPNLNSDLYVLKLNSGQPRKTVTNPEHDGAPSWTGR